MNRTRIDTEKERERDTHTFRNETVTVAFRRNYIEKHVGVVVWKHAECGLQQVPVFNEFNQKKKTMRTRKQPKEYQKLRLK